MHSDYSVITGNLQVSFAHPATEREAATDEGQASGRVHDGRLSERQGPPAEPGGENL